MAKTSSSEMAAHVVGVGLVGAGWWGTTAHVPAIKRHPRAHLLAVQGRDADRIGAVAKDFEVPHACTTMEQLLDVPGLDAVIISSTPNVHYAQAKAALNRGKHVLLEKPMTMTAAEAEELVDLAKHKGLHFLISCPWHYTPHATRARELISSGKLGRLKMISILMTNFTLGLYQGLPWDKIFGNSPTLQNSAKPYREPGRTSYSDPSTAGGGQIYCQVSHVAAYVGLLTGCQPAEVFARFDNAGTPVDVYDALSIKLDDGTLVSIASHGATMLSDRQFELRVYGTDGMLLMELWKGTMEFHDLKCNIERMEPIPEVDTYPLFAPAENLIDVVAGLAPNKSPAELGLFAMRVTEASVESAKSGRNVVLSTRKSV